MSEGAGEGSMASSMFSFAEISFRRVTLGEVAIPDCISVSACCLRIWIKTSIVSLDDGCVAYCHNGSVVNPTHDHLMQTGTLDLVRQRSTRSRRKLRLLDLSNLST